MQHKAKKTTGESKPMVRDLALTLVVANYFANAGFYVRNSGSMCWNASIRSPCTGHDGKAPTERERGVTHAQAPRGALHNLPSNRLNYLWESGHKLLFSSGFLLVGGEGDSLGTSGEAMLVYLAYPPPRVYPPSILTGDGPLQNQEETNRATKYRSRTEPTAKSFCCSCNYSASSINRARLQIFQASRDGTQQIIILCKYSVSGCTPRFFFLKKKKKSFNPDPSSLVCH